MESQAVTVIMNEFKSFRGEMDRRFNRVEMRLDGIDKRLDGVDKRLDGVDKRLDGHDDRFLNIEKLTHRLGMLYEEMSERMERAGEGIESILLTLNRLVERDSVVENQDVRISALESWSKNHQSVHDNGL